MKRIFSTFIVVIAVLIALPAFALEAAPTSPNWDITGVWNVVFDTGGGTYPHTMTVSSFNTTTGEFSGTGVYDPNTGYTWDVTGTVIGDTIDFHIIYTGISAGSTFDSTGTIAPDGLSMAGTWDSGTWTATGVAIAIEDTLVVDDDLVECPDAAFTSIQDAIDDGSADVITVCAGTYTEQLTIEDDLTLIGAGVGVSSIEQPGSLTTDVFGKKNLVTVGGVSHIDMSGFSLVGLGSGLDYGVFVQDDAELNFHENEIVTIGSGGGNIGMLVGRNADSTVGTATITGNSISGYGKGAIVVDGVGSYADIDNNIITGGGPSVVAQNGIQISRGATGTVTYNTITGHVCDNDPEGCGDDPTTSLTADGASGVLLYAAGNPVEVAHNTLTGNQFNVWAVGSEHAYIHHNTITGGSGVGVAIWDADQWTDALGFTETTTTGSIEYNTIQNHDTGIIIRDYVPGGAAPAVEAHYNTITPNTFGAWSNIAFNAELNEWGDCTGPYNATNNPSGLGDPVSDLVDADPVLTGCSGAIYGSKFEDINGNGIRDIDPETEEYTEPTIQGWKIRAKNKDTNVVTTTFTDADGNYAFTDLVPGTYKISEKQVDGWMQTAPLDPNTYTVTLEAGDAITDLDFGNFKLAEIHGVKYEDINGNGHRDDSEPLLPGWEITLEGPEGSQSAITDGDGAYAFYDLGPYDYVITETMQTGWGQSQPGPQGDYAYSVIPESGYVYGNVNFGNYLFATIKGRKYHDANLNGQREASEEWLSGWTIRLTNLQTGEVLEDVTNGNGRYKFTELAPGSYIVQEILQGGWIPVNPSSSIHNVTIISDQVLSGIHFGNATIEDKIATIIPGYYGSSAQNQSLPEQTILVEEPPVLVNEESNTPSVNITIPSARDLITSARDTVQNALSTARVTRRR